MATDALGCPVACDVRGEEEEERSKQCKTDRQEEGGVGLDSGLGPNPKARK